MLVVIAAASTICVKNASNGGAPSQPAVPPVQEPSPILEPPPPTGPQGRKRAQWRDTTAIFNHFDNLHFRSWLDTVHDRALTEQGVDPSQRKKQTASESEQQLNDAYNDPQIQQQYLQYQMQQQQHHPQQPGQNGYAQQQQQQPQQQPAQYPTHSQQQPSGYGQPPQRQNTAQYAAQSAQQAGYGASVGGVGGGGGAFQQPLVQSAGWSQLSDRENAALQRVPTQNHL